MPQDTSKKAYQDNILEFRKKHFKEMERNLEVAIEIREGEYIRKKVKCLHCKKSFEIPWGLVKDINEAIKNISRMLGSLASEKVEGKGRIQVQSKKPKLKDKHKATLDKILNAK